MVKNIINLEINELSPYLVKEYISKNKKSNLSKLLNKEILKIHITKVLDIEKERLYPSQTWASFNTGKAFSEHKCYWYSDNLISDQLIWNKLVLKNNSFGVLGSIHSSKYPKNLFKNKNYKFYLPDCFSSKDLTKPSRYTYFQSLNNRLVGKSNRVTGLKNLLLILLMYSKKIIIFPRRFGISFFSIKMIILIFFYSILFKNKEILRIAQFPLLASIFTDLYIKYKPNYSTLFSNHVAGNMHRYWYAHDTFSFKNKNKYPLKWIKQNKSIIFKSIDLLDSYLGYILSKKDFKNSTILITSSMGQEANPKFDDKFLAKYDGKIKETNLFLKKFYSYFYKKFDEKIEFVCSRNMAPQYGFKLKYPIKTDIKVVVKSITDFVKNLGLVSSATLENGSIVLTLDPYTDINYQEKYSLKEANKNLSKYGFEFFPIEDHHSGSHSEYGSLITINASSDLNKNIEKYIEKEGYLNYLNYCKLITEYF